MRHRSARLTTHALAFFLGCSLTLYLVNLELGNAAQRARGGRGGGTLPQRFARSHFLVVVVLSAPANQEARSAVRQTWGGYVKKSDRTGLYFVVGEAALGHEAKAALAAEQESHGDLLILPVVDAYRALTLKLLETFKLLDSDYRFNYVLKTDDDTFVRLPALLEELRNVRDERPVYWGYFHGRGTVFREGKWKETDWFLCDRYLPYAYGGGYVLSQKLVQFIAHNADKLSIYKSEDVSVATWVAPLNVSRHHDVRFDTQNVSRGCRNSYLVVHKQSPDDMRRLFLRLQTTGQLCQTEVDNVKPYLYDWKALPSKCCKTEG